MANGKPLSQKSADEILDIIDAYIDIKEAVSNMEHEEKEKENKECENCKNEYCKYSLQSKLKLHGECRNHERFEDVEV